MSYAVMPLIDYKTACDKIREKVDITGVKFEETDFGFLRSEVFTVPQDSVYIFSYEFSDPSKFPDLYYSSPEWEGETSPGYFEPIDSNSAETASKLYAGVQYRIFIADSLGLTPKDILKASLLLAEEIVVDFVPPPKIKSGELADKVEEVYWTAANNFGLKGKGQGELVTLNNVHPIEHKVEVGLRSKNLVNILAPDSIPSNGYDVLDDNSIRVYSNRGYIVGVKYSVYAPVGTTITMSYEYELGGEATGHYNVCHIDGNAMKVEKTITKPIPASGKLEFEFARIGGSGNDKNGWIDIKNFQVEIGDTPTAYAPFVADFSDCKVKVNGKNLLNINREQGKPLTVDASWNITNGLEFEFDKYYMSYLRTNKYYHNYGTATIENSTVSMSVINAWFGIGFPLKAIPNTTYTLSAEFETQKSHIAVTYYDNLGNFIEYKDGNPVNFLTFTTPSNCDFMVISVANRVSGEIITVSNIQVEFGATVTAHKPYIGAEYTAAADGTVEGVKSISPTMNISTDKAGAIINAECFLDPEAVITDLTNTVITLGGEI